MPEVRFTTDAKLQLDEIDWGLSYYHISHVSAMGMQKICINSLHANFSDEM